MQYTPTIKAFDVASYLLTSDLSHPQWQCEWAGAWIDYIRVISHMHLVIHLSCIFHQTTRTHTDRERERDLGISNKSVRGIKMIGVSPNMGISVKRFISSVGCYEAPGVSCPSHHEPPDP